ncbi:DNA damage-regulated autophagy modulator protein 1-like, partial [Amphiura filiformis]|uniref:DNA damage-regulated autophagy modulator protein 1-like n=1 Tax=Amphiura filiformis TaxID=82378 RepID=UPI003B2144AD
MDAQKSKRQFTIKLTEMSSACCACRRHTNEKETQDKKPHKRRPYHLGIAWLPICTSTFGLLTILITYLFAVGYNHIPPLLPFISDTGVAYPESSIFSLFLDLVAALLITTMFIRYKLIGQYHCKLEEEEGFKRIGRANTAGLVLGVISALGLAILANFPEDENLMAHLMGAFFCFTCGVAYCFIHTWLSFKTSPLLSPPYMCFLRLSLASFAALTTALVILFGTALRWDADECNPQIYYRRISAAFEWFLIVTFDLFFLTFALEFKSIKLTHEFKHFKGGSWVAFTPVPTSETVSGTASVESESRRNSCNG